MRRVVPVIIVLALAGLVVFLSVRRFSAETAEKGVYSGTTEAEESRVGSTVGGRIISTPVKEGDMVREGQLIVRLQDDQLVASLGVAVAAEKQAAAKLRDLQLGPRQQEIDQASAAVHQSQSQLDKLRRGSRPEEIAAAKAALGQAREKLALVKNGPRKEQIAQAKANLEGAVADRRYADANLARTKKLADEGAVAAQSLDQAQDAASVAQSREDAARQALDELLAGSRVEDIRVAEQAVKQAEANYVLVKKGPRVEDIHAAEAAVAQGQAALSNIEAGTREYQIAQAAAAAKQAHAQVNQVEANVRERAVFAPLDGQLLVLNVRPGDIVTPGQSVATIVDPRRLFIRIYVSAHELGNLTIGKKLQVVTDSGLRVTGIVEQIPVEAEFTPRNVQTPEERTLQQYAVKIRVPNPDLRLRAGMSATVRLGPG
jgi:HlyD family secretion protein